MANLFYVRFSAFGAPQRVDFEFQEKAEAFADRLAAIGFDDVQVHDEFDPRRVADQPDGSAEVFEVPPVYEPDAPEVVVEFACKHIDAILEGGKILTVRWDLDSDVQPDTRVAFETPAGYRFATATIDKRSMMTASKFARSRLAGHRTYESTKEFLDEMKEYYPDVPMERNTRFDIVWWKEVTALVS